MEEKIVSACHDCDQHLMGVPKDECAPGCEKRFIPIKKIGHATLVTMDPVIKKRNKKTTRMMSKKRNLLLILKIILPYIRR